MSVLNIGSLVEPTKSRRMIRPRTPPSDGCIFPESSHKDIARKPGTDYRIRLLQYNQRKAEYAEQYKETMSKTVKDELHNMAFFKSSENRFYHKQLHARVKNKIEHMRASIPVRREKLKKLFIDEKKQQFLETIAQAQKVNKNTLENLRQKVAEVREKRNKKTEEFVKQKRLLQMFDKTDAFRSSLTHKNLEDSKKCQLQQIQENIRRKECEQQLENMWHDLKMKTIKEMEQKEIHEATLRKLKELEDIEIRNKQIEGRKVLIAGELNRSRYIERIEMEKAAKQLQEDLEKAQRMKQQQAAEMRRFLSDQINERQAVHRQQAEQERIIDEAYKKLLEETLAAEKAAVTNRKAELRFEWDMFKNYDSQIKEAQRRDAEAFERLVSEDRKALDKIKMEEQRKLCEYRRDLAKQLHSERQQISRDRQERAEKEKEYSRLYDETIRRMNEIDLAKEKEEKARLFEEQKQYYSDLWKQHEYQLLTEERKRQEEREIQQSAYETENEIDRIIDQIRSGNISMTKQNHPFVPFINKDCTCPKTSN